MPKYKVDIEGQGSFQVESDDELTDDQAYEAVQSQLSQEQQQPQQSQQPQQQDESTPASTNSYDAIKSSSNPLESMRTSLGISRQQQDPDRFGKYYDDPNIGQQGAVQQFLSRTGRRVGEAVDLGLQIPQSALDTITGSDERPRWQSALRTIGGIAAPISIALSPIEASAEEALSGFGMGEESSRLAGTLVGALGTLGVGLISKTGKLGPLAEEVAKFLGVGKINDFQEKIKTDPQLEWAASRRMDQQRPLEEAIRSNAPQAQLNEMVALQLKSPELAQVAFDRKIAENDVYFSFAKANKIMSDLPEEPRFEPTPRLVFDGVTKYPDAGILGALSSPVQEAAYLKNPLAVHTLLEIQKTEMEIQKGIIARGKRTEAAVTGIGAEDLKKAIVMRANETMTHGDKMLLPESQLSAGAKKALQYMQDKMAVDVQVALPRLRERATELITPIVQKEYGLKAKEWGEALDNTLVAKEVQRRVMEKYPDTFGPDQLLPGIFPGYYKIMDSKGNMMGSADYYDQALTVIHGLAQEKGLKSSKDFKIEHKSYFDPETLRLFKGPVEQSYKKITEAMGISEKGIDAAIAGKFGFRENYKFLEALFQKPKSDSAYTKDFFSLWNTWDRTLERYTQLSDLRKKVLPAIQEIAATGQTRLAKRVATKMDRLYGRRLPLSQSLDNTIASIPGLRDIVAPQALESLVSWTKAATVNTFLTFSPRYHAVNSTQTLSTLYPIVDDVKDIVEAGKLMADPAGKKLLEKHGITNMSSKIEGVTRGQGPIESANQQGAFLTMYNVGRKQGLTDSRAADYAKVRGNVYSQFFGLTSDQSHLFTLDPTGGLLTMFMRFPIKQTEQFIDIVKGRNYPGAAKWLGVNLALGGMKAAIMGGAGWLGYDIYKKIEKEYGQGVADLAHHGLPSLAGVDVSNSIRMLDAPFGETLGEKAGNLLMGPAISTGYSILESTLNKNQGIQPEMGRRAYEAMVSRVPLAKELDALKRLFMGEYDFNDASGRLKFKATAGDLIKKMLGFKPSGGKMGEWQGTNQMKESEIEQFSSALLEMESRRQDVISYAASRYGQAQAAGISLGKDLEAVVRKEVYDWNERWPEFPITGTEIQERTKAKVKSAMQSLSERMLKGSPAALRHSPAFQPIGESNDEDNNESNENNNSSFLAPGGG